MTTALIDGDIVTFRAAFSAEEEGPEIACMRAGYMVNDICLETGADSFRVFLSGKYNFRYQIYPEYKANRLTAKRPRWEQHVKEYLTTEFDAEWSDGCEADDLLGINQTNETIICTIDKDLDQVPGEHYNFVKRERYTVSPEKALYNFYYQCLVGDSADGIKGVAGIGPKKASRILAQCESEREMYETVREAYGIDEAFEMNAKVLWIQRAPGEIWKPKKWE